MATLETGSFDRGLGKTVDWLVANDVAFDATPYAAVVAGFDIGSRLSIAPTALARTCVIPKRRIDFRAIGSAEQSPKYKSI